MPTRLAGRGVDASWGSAAPTIVGKPSSSCRAAVRWSSRPPLQQQSSHIEAAVCGGAKSVEVVRGNAGGSEPLPNRRARRAAAKAAALAKQSLEQVEAAAPWEETPPPAVDHSALWASIIAAGNAMETLRSWMYVDGDGALVGPHTSATIILLHTHGLLHDEWALRPVGKANFCAKWDFVKFWMPDCQNDLLCVLP